MISKLKSLIFFYLLMPFICISATLPELVTELDLSYTNLGNTSIGLLYSEEEILNILSNYPNLLALNLSGQSLNSGIGEALANKPLEKLSLRGNIANQQTDDYAESVEELVVEQIDSGFLMAFIKGGGSKLKVLDLDYSNITDEGLLSLGEALPLLEEISLVGSPGITDAGLRLLVAQSPKLKTIHVGSVNLMNREEIPLTISPELIQEMKANGISLIIQERHPF